MSDVNKDSPDSEYSLEEVHNDIEVEELTEDAYEDELHKEPYLLPEQGSMFCPKCAQSYTIRLVRDNSEEMSDLAGTEFEDIDSTSL